MVVSRSATCQSAGRPVALVAAGAVAQLAIAARPSMARARRRIVINIRITSCREALELEPCREPEPKRPLARLAAMRQSRANRPVAIGLNRSGFDGERRPLALSFQDLILTL